MAWWQSPLYDLTSYNDDMEQVNLDVQAFDFNDESIEHMARHRVQPEDVLEVLNASPQFFLNRRGRSAPNAIVGPNAAGRFHFVAIIPIDDEGTWRPVTAHWMERRRALRYYGGQS